MRLLLDRRVGGATRYYFAEAAEELMRVPDDIRKCVVFICYRDARNDLRFAGTAFFVADLSPEFPDQAFEYLVTAKHVIAGLAHAGHEPFYIRVNLKSGGHALIESTIDHWTLHETPSADVAAMMIPIPAGLDHRSFLLGGATAEIVEKHRIGIGDEIFVAGLFVSHTGHQRNIPLIRIGTIAAVPEEPVDTDMGMMDGYLIEMRSIGGVSGSPVFVHLDPFRHPDHDAYWLLGLVHGHWNIKNKSKVTILEKDLEKEKVNMGIAIVPPVDRILEVLHMPEFVARREEVERRQKEQNRPVPDSTTEAGSFTKKDFEDVLRKVSRRISPPDEASSET